MPSVTLHITRWKALIGLGLAALAAGLTIWFSQAAHADSDGTHVSGDFSFAGKLLVGCPHGAVLCSSGSMTGGLAGSFTLSFSNLVPSPHFGVNYFAGKLVLTTDSGILRCDLNGALNTKSSSEGEFAEICVVTAGTGRYLGATGDLRMIGTSTERLGIPTGAGEFVGTVVTR